MSNEQKEQHKISAPTLELLIRKGYFPDELPYFFTCDNLANYLAKNENSVISLCNKKTQHINFRLARPGNAPRILGIPNPVSYIGLCKFIEEKWNDIEVYFTEQKGALSKPKTDLDDGARVIARQYHIESHREVKLSQRRKGRFLLKTDVAKFYPSIYTHSIDWAIRGKGAAKKDPYAKISGAIKLGTKLDEKIRQCQHNQTNGILIGPDSSFLAAEIIMAQIDKSFSDVPFTRNTDDFEFVTNTKEEAESVLARLGYELEKFGLSINDEKTSITQLPEPIEKPWVGRLRQFDLSEEYWKWQKDQLYDYFNTAFELSKKYPKDSVLRFAIGRLKNERTLKKIHYSNLKHLFDFALHCALNEPGTLKNIIGLIKLIEKQDFLNYVAIEETLNKIVLLHAPLNHSSEVCWALWAIDAFGLDLEIKGTALEKLKETTDCISIILSLLLMDKGHIKEDLTQYKPWSEIINNPKLYPEYWLLSYEAAIRGWSGMTPDRLAENNNDFEALKVLAKANVSFIKNDK